MPPPDLPHPKKRYGQNFLVDQNIIKKILATAAIQPHETVLEIGPGRGSLTSALCKVASRVLAIEIDHALTDYLKSELSHCANLDVQSGDALKFPCHTLPSGTVVVANLPYNISTPLLFMLLEAGPVVDRMVLMVQLEVAQRIVAQSGTKTYGVLSVMAQYFADVNLAFKVPRTCFRPRPEVESAVIAIRRKPKEQLESFEDIQKFTHVVRSAFSHRRKTLFNAMRDAGFVSTALTSVFDRVGIDGTRRAETLSLSEFKHLARTFEASQVLSLRKHLT